MAAVALGVPALVVWRGTRAVDDNTLHRWEQRFDVAVPHEHRGATAIRLRRNRRLRATAVAAGLLVGYMPAFVNLVDATRSAEFANPMTQEAWLVLAALGALLAEVVACHRPSGPRRAALVRRRIGDYVGPGWVGATAVLAAAAIGAAVVAPSSDAPDRGWAWVYAAGAVIAVVALAQGLRVVRDRALAVPEGPERDIDEAFRADGAHHLAGAGLALAASCAAGAVGAAAPDATVLSLLFTAVACGALGTWWSLARTTPWSVSTRRLAHA